MRAVIKDFSDRELRLALNADQVRASRFALFQLLIQFLHPPLKSAVADGLTLQIFFHLGVLLSAFHFFRSGPGAG